MSDKEEDFESADEDIEEKTEKVRESVKVKQKSVNLTKKSASTVNTDTSVNTKAKSTVNTAKVQAADKSKTKVVKGSATKATTKQTKPKTSEKQTKSPEKCADVRDKTSNENISHKVASVNEITKDTSDVTLHDSQIATDVSKGNSEETLVDTDVVKTDNKTTLDTQKSDTQLDVQPQQSDNKQSSTKVSPDSQKGDDTSNIVPVTEQPKHDETVTTPETKQSSGWGSWGNWGASLISVASSSVSTFTSQVEEGWQTVLETVESSLGAPTPEEMAEIEAEEEKNAKPEAVQETVKDTEEEEGESGEDGEYGAEKGKDGFWSNLGIQEFDEIRSLVTDKGKKLVSGGLDVLETIGKKTFDVVTLNDPGFKRTRDALGNQGNRPNLSALLREAKESANERAAEKNPDSDEANQSNFSSMFDEYQGLAHLEALEILSSQSERKVQMLIPTLDPAKADHYNGLLNDLRTEFDWEELSQDEDDDEDRDHDFGGLVKEHLSRLECANVPDRLSDVHSKVRHWLTTFTLKEPHENEHSTQAKEVHVAAIQSLAELTSRSMEQLHKTAELILLHRRSENVLQQANTLAALTKVLCAEVGILSAKFTRCLSQIAAESEDSDLIHPLMTIVYLEASNSSTYIQDAFQLLHPVLQQAILDSP